MVARKTNAEVGSENLAIQAFDSWRRMLWRLKPGTADAAGSPAPGALDSRPPSRAPLLRNGAFAAGMCCLLAGCVLRASFPTGAITAETVLAGVGVAGWALVRLIVLHVFASAAGRTRADIRSAWSIGLIPLAVSLNGWFAAAAWVVSGIATAMMMRLYLDRDRSMRLVAAAWGVQLALQASLVALNWIMLYALVVMFS